jgi:hypothetical protein
MLAEEADLPSESDEERGGGTHGMEGEDARSTCRTNGHRAVEIRREAGEFEAAFVEKFGQTQEDDKVSFVRKPPAGARWNVHAVHTLLLQRTTLHCSLVPFPREVRNLSHPQDRRSTVAALPVSSLPVGSAPDPAHHTLLRSLAVQQLRRRFGDEAVRLQITEEEDAAEGGSKEALDVGSRPWRLNCS